MVELESVAALLGALIPLAKTLNQIRSGCARSPQHERNRGSSGDALPNLMVIAQVITGAPDGGVQSRRVASGSVVDDSVLGDGYGRDTVSLDAARRGSDAAGARRAAGRRGRAAGGPRHDPGHVGRWAGCA